MGSSISQCLGDTKLLVQEGLYNMELRMRANNTDEEEVLLRGASL